MLEACRAQPFPLRTAPLFLPRSSRASSIASRRPTKSDRAPRRGRSGSSKRQQTRLTDPKDVEANPIAALASRFSPTRFWLTGAVPAGYPHRTACAPRRQAKNALSYRFWFRWVALISPRQFAADSDSPALKARGDEVTRVARRESDPARRGPRSCRSSAREASRRKRWG